MINSHHNLETVWKVNEISKTKVGLSLHFFIKSKTKVGFAVRFTIAKMVCVWILGDWVFYGIVFG